MKLFDKESFEAEVVKTGKATVIDCYADWCGPCKMLAPVLEAAIPNHPSLQFGKIDADANPDLAARYGVMGLPTLLLIKDGEAIDRMVGYQGPGKLREWLTQAANR